MPHYREELQKNGSFVLPSRLTQALQSSSNALVRDLFESTAHRSTSSSSSSRPLSYLDQQSINSSSLRSTLSKTRISSVKCVRPNVHGDRNKLESSYVRYQIERHRVVDYLKVIKSSYIYSFTLESFLQRYKLLSLKTWPKINANKDLVENAFELLSDLCFEFGNDYVIGKHFIFFKLFTGVIDK
jgi:myosin heavy subunit